MCTCSFIFFYTNCIRKLEIQVQIQRSVQRIANSLQLYYYFPLNCLAQFSSSLPTGKFPKDRVNLNIEENYGLRISKTKRPGSSLDLHDIDLNNELAGGGSGSPCLKLHVQCSLNILYTLYVLFSTLYSYILFTFTATL